jgi:hypothetical protein
MHGKFKDNFTFLCHNGEGGGAPYPCHTSQTSFDTHFVSNLFCLLIQATALLTLLADTDYGLSEPTKIAEAKIVNPKLVKRRSVRNDRIFLEDCP